MKVTILFFIALIVLASCGESKIFVRNNIPANIYVDGKEKGTGEVYIKRFGFKKNVHVKVIYSGYPIMDTTLVRTYNVKLAIATILTAGLVYTVPLTVLALLYERQLDKSNEMLLPSVSPWEEPYNSFWNKKN